MHNAWFFGGSTTTGQGSRPGWEYYDYVKGDTTPWTDIFCSELNYIQNNCGINGATNEHVFEQIQINFNKIKFNDVVIISPGSSLRSFFFIEGYSEMFRIGSDKLSMKYEDVPIRYSNYTKLVGKDFKKSMFLGLKEYTLNVRLPAIEKYKEFYRKQYQFYIDIIPAKKIIFWEYEIWKKFETISKATDGLIEDKHWSKVGHLDFFNYIKTKYINYEQTRII